MIKFVEITINPYDRTIEHCVEKSSPINQGGQISVRTQPAIPVAIPPARPMEQVDYIRKQFCVVCDADITADILRMVLIDVDGMPSINPKFERKYKIGFLDYESTARDYNEARKENGMSLIDIRKEVNVLRPSDTGENR